MVLTSESKEITFLECQTLNHSVRQHKISEPELVVPKRMGPIQETIASREYLESSYLTHAANDLSICKTENKVPTLTCAAEKKFGLRHSLVDNNDDNVVLYTDKLQPAEIEADLVQPNGVQNKRSSTTVKSGCACTICHLQCVNQWHLKDHMLSHTGEEVYKCSVCEKQFSRKYDVKRHMSCHTRSVRKESLKHHNLNGSKDKHQKREFGTNFLDAKYITTKTETVSKSAKSQLTCTVCALQWQSRKNLESHMLVHTGEKTSKCTICERPFRRIYDLNRHMLLIHNKTVQKSSPKNELKRLTHGSKTIQKRSQNEQVSTRSLDTHALTKPTASKSIIKCNICTKQFHRRAYLKKHMRYHSVERPYACSVCGKKFKVDCDLDHHMWIHSEETVLCHVCGKQFTCCQKLKRHMVLHTETREHRCDVCGKNFTWATNLWAHRQSHFQHTPYTCDLCNKTFTKKDNIRTHIRLTHFGVKQHACSVCSKEFVTKSHLNDHIRIHIGSRPYKCEICEKGFTKQDHLKKHTMLHTGETPFSCKTCNQQFKRAENLKVHMLIHAGVKPHACEVCGQRFRQKSSMKNHMLRHTSMEQITDSS